MSKSNTVEYILAKFDKSGGSDTCWPWMRGKDKDGYGKTILNEKHVRAHRIAYEAVYGKLARGDWVLHRCDNPCCGNPKHLFIGNAQANATDRDMKRRLAWGERGSLAKLSNEQVGEIRRLRSAGLSQSKVAKMFGVCPASISHIDTGRTWRYSMEVL